MYVHTDDAEHGEANPQAVDHASRRDEPNADLLARIAVAAERFRGDIRAALAGFSEPSPKSAAVYSTLYRRIWGGTRLNDFATNKHAYYQARAGYIFGCRKDLQKVLAGFENSMAADHWEYAKELADRGRTLLRDLKQVPPDNDRERWREADYVGEYRQLAGDNPPAHPNTKRPGLSSLPPEWRSSIVKTAQDAGSKYTLAIAVQMVTGCRPIELCAGISVTPAANGALAFRIRGAKVQAGSQGQERRELVVPDDGRLELQLLKQSLQATGFADAGGFDQFPLMRREVRHVSAEAAENVASDGRRAVTDGDACERPRQHVDEGCHLMVFVGVNDERVEGFEIPRSRGFGCFGLHHVDSMVGAPFSSLFCVAASGAK